VNPRRILTRKRALQSSVDAATVVDMAADKSGDVAHLICSHGDDDTYVESVDRKSRRTWGRSLRASAIVRALVHWLARKADARRAGRAIGQDVARCSRHVHR